MDGLHVTRDAMEYISFITVQSGDDLAMSFAIQGLDPSGTRNPVFWVPFEVIHRLVVESSTASQGI